MEYFTIHKRNVTPCVGVWIETEHAYGYNNRIDHVTPCVGVWIETLGLIVIVDSIKVTPCVGVWIETDIV